MRAILVIPLLALALAGCARPERQPQPPLTERQRDSILATQPLPGANVVGRALEASDRAASDATDTQAALDSLEH